MATEAQPLIHDNEGEGGGGGRSWFQNPAFRSLLVITLVAVVIGVSAGVAVGVRKRDTALEDAKKLLAANILIDGHNDLPWVYRKMVLDAVWSLNINASQPELQTDIPRILQGGLGGQFWSVFVGCDYQHADAVRATQEQIDVVYQMTERWPSFFELARTADDVERIYSKGKFPSLMGIEGGHQFDSSLASLRSFYRAGVRYATLTHNCNTPWSQSCCDPTPFPDARGLTDFGIKVVKEMNRLGMLVDISHTSAALMHTVLDVSDSPVIFSHSNCRSICNTTRNVPDDVIIRLKENGGVMMITFVPGFVNCQDPSKATISQVVDHMDHVKALAGVDHIGIGGDFDGISQTIENLSTVADYPNLFAEMIRRGYTDEECIKIMGANSIRVLREAEKVSQAKQKIIPGQAVLNNITEKCRTIYNIGRPH